jgi:hypothetical protein
MSMKNVALRIGHHYRSKTGRRQTAAPSEKSESGYFVPEAESSGDTVRIADDKTTPSADNNRIGPADE